MIIFHNLWYKVYLKKKQYTLNSQKSWNARVRGNIVCRVEEDADLLHLIQLEPLQYKIRSIFKN